MKRIAGLRDYATDLKTTICENLMPFVEACNLRLYRPTKTKKSNQKYEAATERFFQLNVYHSYRIAGGD